MLDLINQKSSQPLCACVLKSWWILSASCYSADKIKRKCTQTNTRAHTDITHVLIMSIMLLLGCCAGFYSLFSERIPLREKKKKEGLKSINVLNCQYHVLILSDVVCDPIYCIHDWKRTVFFVCLFVYNSNQWDYIIRCTNSFFEKTKCCN